MLKGESLSQFFRYMAQFSAAGVPIIDAVKYTQTVVNKEHADDVEAVADAMSSRSMPFYQALEEASLVPESTIPAIKAGETAGKLETVLSEMADFYERFDSIIKQSTPQIVTPILYVLAGLGIFVAFVLFLFPMFLSNEQMSDPNASFLIKLVVFGESVKENSIIYIIGLGVLFFFGITAFRSETQRQKLFILLFKVPMMGEGVYELYIAMWSKFFAILIEAGVPFNDALKLTKNVVPAAVGDDLELLDEIQRDADASKIDNDENIPERWPPLFTAALRVGFPTGAIPKMLSNNATPLMTNGKRKIEKFVGYSNKAGLAFVAIEVLAIMGSILSINLSQMQGVM